MKTVLANLSAPIEKDVIRFREFYTASLKSRVKLINTVIGYISRKKGKQVRPHLTLLSARMCGEPSELTYRAAALIEMLHVATLIHDDVVDDADIRRGWPSVKRVWKNKLAILVGDYMFSKALSNMIHLRDFDALDLLSKTAERLSEGEIRQIESAIRKDMTEEIYYGMVSDKTASLISSACELGAITVTEDLEKREAMRQYGEKVGIAFQIKDDLFDVLGTTGVGKPTGFDLKKNMMTLPMIHFLEQLPEKDRKQQQRILKNHARRGDLKQVRKMIQNSGSINYAREVIQKFSNEARAALQLFGDSEYKAALNSFIDFNLNREY